MSLPRTPAERVHDLGAGLYHWTVSDDRLDGHRSDAWGIATPAGTVVIDPLPLAESAFDALGKVGAICLTAASHQRAAWNLRRSRGIRVFAPRGAERMLEEIPDETFSEGDTLPGGLRAFATPGPKGQHHALLATLGDGRTVLFVGDLVLEHAGSLRPLPPAHLADPAAARASVARLAELQVDLVAPAHGDLVPGRSGRALRAALRPPPDSSGQGSGA